MTDFDQFERGLAAALRLDADESISPSDPVAVARVAIASHRRPTRPGWNVLTMNYARVTVAAAIAVAVVGGAFYLIGPDRGTIGPSGPPEPSPSVAIAASQSPTAPSGTRPPGAGSWTVTGSMIEARAWGATITLLEDGTVLVTGGTDGERGSAEIYDPSDGSWSATWSMNPFRQGHSATLLPDGTVLVAGGDGFGRSAELRDPVTGTWTATGKMIEGRTTHGAVLLLDGRVLVVGGGGDSRSAELFNPIDGTWTATGSMTQARNGHTTTLLADGRVLVAGGHDDDRLASAELYDPVTETWTATQRMTEAFLVHTATLLPNGTVLVAGGDAPIGPGARGHAHAALYDPGSGDWTAAEDMLMARFIHTATLLFSGEVLVAGGRFHSGLESAAFGDAELYDPATGSWAAAAAMHSARSQHSAIVLTDGRVLVVGGYGADGQPTNSAELFDRLAAP